MDGFVKQDQDCYIVLPSVHKKTTPASSNTPQQQSQQAGILGEVVLKANVLPLDYEFP
jgi:hypothetical protein